LNQIGDFERIAQFIGEYAPSIHTKICVDGCYRLKRWALAARPTMVFSPPALRHFKPVRGKVFAGNSLKKSEEYAALEAAGVAVPRYRVLTEQNPQPDLSALGKYVVVKPDRGGRGAHVRIMKSTKAKWQPTESRIAGQSDSLVAQEFIYTGAWPVSYRVTTLFGQVIWALKVEANHSRASLPQAASFDAHPGLSVCSNSKGCVMSLMNDERIIRFGEAAHRAFPDIPLLGVDVIQRQPDGELFIVEVNSSGWVWHFSSPLGLRAQKEFGFTFEEQFDGLRKAARILADQTMVHAV
jgi:hypothetical protein